MPNCDKINIGKWENGSVIGHVSAAVKGDFLVALVDKVKGLDHVVVKSTSFINDEDELVVVPGPWSIVKPLVSQSRIPPGNSSGTEVIDFRSDEDEDDEEEDEEEETPAGSNNSTPLRRFRSPSTTVSNQPTSRSSNSSPTHVLLGRSAHSHTPPKCVIRNEFGHARIQQYIIHPEKVHTHYHTLLTAEQSLLTIPEEELFETGGHVVLHLAVFKKCIARGWGMRHPLAGHFHPITGTEIPPTTMLFRAPRTESELEVIWKIVVKSYLWVLSQPAEAASARQQ